MELGGGERQAERLHALQLPHNIAYGDGTSGHGSTLLTEGKPVKRGSA